MRQEPDFADIYDRWYSRVYNYVRYRVRRPEAADDVTARVFEAALDNLGSYDPARAPVQVWLFGIARNAVTDWFREAGRRAEVALDGREPDSGEVPAGLALERREEAEQLLAAVSSLDARSRDLIALKFSSGMTNRDIAQVTGLGESNIGVIIYRAVKQLQAALAEKKI